MLTFLCLNTEIQSYLVSRVICLKYKKTLHFAQKMQVRQHSIKPNDSERSSKAEIVWPTLEKIKHQQGKRKRNNTKRTREAKSRIECETCVPEWWNLNSLSSAYCPKVQGYLNINFPSSFPDTNGCALAFLRLSSCCFFYPCRDQSFRVKRLITSTIQKETENIQTYFYLDLFKSCSICLFCWIVK